MNLRRWLRPGIGVKRWVLVAFLGLVALALAGALLLRQAYRDVEVEGPLQAFLYVVTLQFLPYAARGAALAGLGLVLFGVGSFRLIRALTDPFRAGVDQPFVEVIYQKRFLARGPRIVAIGGGTGLSTLLRGLKDHTSNLTAIVTMADDGGSSGKLREALGIPPMGDLRNCIAALADAEPLMTQLLQYRFPEATVAGAGASDASEAPEARAATGTGDVASPGSPDASLALASSPSSSDAGRLAGHTVGNLRIAAMTAIEQGDFEEGVRTINRVLAVRGQVIPVTPRPLTLHARLEDGSEIEGQARITRTGNIAEVWVSPGDVSPSDDAIRAIRDADAIVVGPGSLYTSVVPALLLPDVQRAIRESSAPCIYVANVATQQSETLRMDLAAHADALAAHVGPDLIDIVLANNNFDARVPDGWQGEHLRLTWPPAGTPPRLALEDVVDPENAHHHDPTRLAAAVMRIVEREAGSRRRTSVARSA
jgi:uncharacterized cofD-like protein